MRSRDLVAPTAAQRLLLRAALLGDRQGHDAWEQWHRGTDLERLDPGSQRLLPQLYRNVREHAQHHPWLERLKGVYRHTWFANGVLLHEAGRLLRALSRAGVRTVAVDGMSLITNYYRDQGARAVESIAIMIVPDEIPEAANVLTREGWDATGLTASRQPWRYASQARVPGGPRAVDLLWDPFPEGCDPEIRGTCWAHAEPCVVAEVACRRLAPTEELLRLCVRAARRDVLPPFRRLADALVLLRTAGPRLDWERFVHQAVRARVVLPVRTSLALLREVLAAPVPEETLRQLRNAPVGTVDRLEQRLSEAPRPRLGRLPDLLFRYRRLARAEHAGVREAGLAGYLREAWDVRRPWQLPTVALRKSLRRMIRPSGTRAV